MTCDGSRTGELGGADHILCNVHRHSGDAMDRLAVTEGSGAKQQFGLIRKGDGKQHIHKECMLHSREKAAHAAINSCILILCCTFSFHSQPISSVVKITYGKLMHVNCITPCSQLLLRFDFMYMQKSNQYK